MSMYLDKNETKLVELMDREIIKYKEGKLLKRNVIKNIDKVLKEHFNKKSKQNKEKGRTNNTVANITMAMERNRNGDLEDGGFIEFIEIELSKIRSDI